MRNDNEKNSDLDFTLSGLDLPEPSPAAAEDIDLNASAIFKGGILTSTSTEGFDLPDETGAGASAGDGAPAQEAPNSDFEAADQVAAMAAMSILENGDADQEEDDEEEPAPKHRGGLIALLCVIGAVIVAAVAALILYKDMYLVLQTELGGGLPEARYYMRDGSTASYVDAPEISLTEEQFYLLTVKSSAGTRKVGLLVLDEAAPVAEDRHLSIACGEHVNPTDVLTTVYDASEWISRWIQEPDYDTIGTCVVSVELRDSHGNTAVIPATLEITAPVHAVSWTIGTEKPEAEDFLVSEGANCFFDESYSEVDWETPGTYPITVYVNGVGYETVVTVE